MCLPDLPSIPPAMETLRADYSGASHDTLLAVAITNLVEQAIKSLGTASLGRAAQATFGIRSPVPVDALALIPPRISPSDLARRTAHAAFEAGCAYNTARQKLIPDEVLPAVAQAIVRADLSARHRGASGFSSRTQTSNDPEGDLIAALNVLHGAPPSVEQLASLVRSPHPIRRAVEVTLALRDVPDDPERYELTWTERFEQSRPGFVFAVVPRTTLAALITATCPDVDTCFIASGEDEAARMAEHLESVSPLWHFKTTDGGLVQRDSVPMLSADEAEHRELLRGVPERERHTVRLFVGRLPGDPGLPRKAEIRTTTTMPRGDHLCYWIAERLQFVQRITFDCSAFTTESGAAPALRPFLGVTATEPELDCGQYRLEVQHWVARGHGVVLGW